MIYTLKRTIFYKSERYGKSVLVPTGYKSDGASGAIDIYSDGWWVHDWLKGSWLGIGPNPNGRKWSDGTECTNLQASYVLHDILKLEGRHIRSKTWFTFTWLWGETFGRF